MEFSAVRKIALAMNGVEESTSYGTPAFKINGALFVRLRPDLDALVIAMSIEDRDAAIEEEPETYFITDHYLHYPWVLVRLSVVKPAILKDLLTHACKFAELEQKKSQKKKRAIRRS